MFLNFNNFFLIVMFVLFVTISNAYENSQNINPFIPKTHVQIKNMIAPNVYLTVHCKSKDDDLGQQVLKYNENFDFYFKVNVWATTLFFCRFQWESTSHWFDIYKYSRDFLNWQERLWHIKPDGPCMLDLKSNKYDVSPNVSLTVHCKSKDDDLRKQLLKYNENYDFYFKVNAWATTLFFCKFGWKSTSHWFDIYKYDRDFFNCQECLWHIKPDGPCMLGLKSKKYDVCYPWNK
ncbi:Self-incomp_S1 domain-containing protein, partial [Cephalotus follicularis]